MSIPTKEERAQRELLTLWVRAGSDGMKNGGDPACQQVFMICLLKSSYSRPDLPPMQLDVKTTNPGKPDPIFKAAGLLRVPAITHKEESLDLLDEILEYLDLAFPTQPALNYFDPDADSSTADLFSKFCFFIKEVNNDPKALETELRRVNEHLLESKTAFLTGPQMTHLDCNILPKLHHIRVAAKALKNYSFPNDLTGIWRYLDQAYNSEVFTKSCPADQEIIIYWADRPDTPNLSPAKRAEMTRQTQVFSIEIPDEVDI